MIPLFLPIYEQCSKLFTLSTTVLPIDLSSNRSLPVKGLIISYPPINPKP